MACWRSRSRKPDAFGIDAADGYGIGIRVRADAVDDVDVHGETGGWPCLPFSYSRNGLASVAQGNHSFRASAACPRDPSTNRKYDSSKGG